jgi:type II secretory pathway component GspD/PulD (secretin)
MKTSRILALAAAFCIPASLHAQVPEDSLIEPVADPVTDLQAEIPSAVTELPPPSLPVPADAAAVATPPAAPPPATAPEGAAPDAGSSFGPLAQQQQEMQKSDEGFIIKDAGLNDIFQFLAKTAGRQYFHNSKITGPDYMVTGHLNDGDPLQQMEELAFMYGLTLHTKGNTLYALTQAQLAQLPSAEFHYQLRYLRPTDMEQIKELIKPMLTPGTGIVNFEPKTNTIVIIDSAHRIEQARQLLHNVDQVKGQIIVETKILRVNSGAAERVGVNWSSSLGKTGTELRVIRDLNSVFGLDRLIETATEGESVSAAPNLVLSPLDVSAVLRALAEGGLASQISNPTLITEDNEQATISIIDRVPIITTTSTQTTSGGNPTVTEEVRYKIDTSDKSIDTDPDKHREIGISLVVTPTLLPDGTVRMRMRPRNAQVTGVVKGIPINGQSNEYPSVTESMIETLARVPDGYSLVVGGFYGEVQSNGKTKVPILGDVPVLNFFFKSKEATKEQTSLVFIVTPKSYNPTSGSATNSASNRIRNATTLDCEHDWVDPYNPGPAHEPNMARSVRGLQPHQAVLHPDSADAFVPADLKGKPRFGRGSRR